MCRTLEDVRSIQANYLMCWFREREGHWYSPESVWMQVPYELREVRLLCEYLHAMNALERKKVKVKRGHVHEYRIAVSSADAKKPIRLVMEHWKGLIEAKGLIA